MASFQNPPPPPAPPTLPPAQLPISHLESLKFKANQIIDSIQALQHTIAAGHQPVMPSWPEILSKYNIILSQTHSFSTSLVAHASSASASASSVRGPGAGNVLERTALHPSVGMSDVQLDAEVIPLLRNQQTLDVLRVENETVRRLAEHMATRGSLGVLEPVGMGKKRTEYEDVLRECEEIMGAHDRRVERAVRAVMMLREKFDWKQRVEVEVEEPEELEWDPRVKRGRVEAGDFEMGENNGVGEENADAEMESGDGGSSDEGEEVQALVESATDVLSPPENGLPVPLAS